MPGVWAVLTAALLGRPIGILASVAFAMAVGLRLPAHLRWRELIVVSLAASAGFTFALFFATSIMPPGPLLAELKLGALSWSTRHFAVATTFLIATASSTTLVYAQTRATPNDTPSAAAGFQAGFCVGLGELHTLTTRQALERSSGDRPPGQLMRGGDHARPAWAHSVVTAPRKFERLVSSNLLDAEVRAALARDRVAALPDTFAGVDWILPD